MTECIDTKPEIPDKRYFKIGEVSSLTGLETHVLRFWESEFSKIKPKRTQSGQRLYRRSDVELIFKIKSLLHEKKFTIQGAKLHLENKSTENFTSEKTIIDEIKNELLSLSELLK